MALRDLSEIPAPVAAALAALDPCDDAFVAGLGRLSSTHLQALADLQAAFATTPLAKELADALAGLGRSEFVERNFLVLACARSAVLGAAHDALVAQACAALARPVPALEQFEATATQALPPTVGVWLESARQWLMELALAGFANLEVEHLLPFQTTLEAMSSEPALARHVALLGGLLDELLTVFPRSGEPEVPKTRWVDLWARAMVLCAAVPTPPPRKLVSGVLNIIATELRAHDHLATLVVHAVLTEASGQLRQVRVSASAFKVDVIQGAELGPLFASFAPNLIAALAERKRLTVQDQPLLATGDLVWVDSRAQCTAPSNTLAEAAADLAKVAANRPILAPADRHPTLLDELVYLSAADIKAGWPLPVDRVRMADTDDLTPTDIAGALGIVAALRFDGGQWLLQPLAVDKGKTMPRMVGTSLVAGSKKLGRASTLATLKERAGKLLRKKS